MSEEAYLRSDNLAPPNEDNPFRKGDWATWTNLVKGIDPGPFLVLDSSVARIRVIQPHNITSEDGMWRPISFFQKYDPKKHLKFMIEYCAILEGKSSFVM